MSDNFEYVYSAGQQSEIDAILTKRQLDASEDWKALGEKRSGEKIVPFDIDRYQDEYLNAAGDKKDDTFLGRFIVAALAQKSMVTNRIYTSGSKLAGVSVDYRKKGFRGIKAFRKLIGAGKEEKV